MKTIYHVPIEPLAERYSEQWYRNFPIEFQAAGFDVRIIEGRPLLDNEIKVGAFLDVNSTIHYKMTQLQEIARLFHEGQVKDGSIFFFGDIEFWGLESVRLMARMNNVRVSITGFLHAASYTKEDAFAVAADFQQFTELGWVAACDKVFVGSYYHKAAFLERRVERLGPNAVRSFGNCIVVTKNPLFLDEYPKFDVLKKRKVLLTNRFDPEKRPGQTLDLFRELKAVFPEWEFVITTGRKAMRGSPDDMAKLEQAITDGVVTVKAGLSKEQYHQELAEAFMVVTHSIEENWGYCISEAAVYGCVTLARRGLSHNELLLNDSRFLFDNPSDAFVKASNVLNSYAPVSPYKADTDRQVNLTSDGMQNIVQELKTL